MTGESALELRTRPTNDVDTIKGSITITAVTTKADGTVGSGTVQFVSDIGELSATEATIDEFGKAEVSFKCVAGMHQYCDMQAAAEVSARWTTPGRALVATRKIPLRRPMPVGVFGDGGSGYDCASTSECQQGLVCFENICVGEGQLRFSLTWTVPSDFDIHLIGPGSPQEVFYGNRSAGGARLDVDACIRAAQCRPTNVENIYYSSTPPAGTYTVYVVNFNGASAGAFRLNVSGGLVPNQQFTGSLPAQAGAESMRFTITR